MKSLHAAVWGASGYAGQELVGILEQHPNIRSVQSVGREMPNNLADIEVAFLALPAGEAGRIARQLRNVGATVIDLSGDFRFKTAKEYTTWYGQAHPAPDLLPAPYAMPELSRDGLLGSKLISVPGCYPTAMLLGIMPLIKAQLIKPHTRLTVDAISGVSGMGKSSKAKADGIMTAGDVRPYATGRVHRHVGEMEQFLGGREVFFSPSVGPFFRGMLVKTTAELQDGVDAGSVNAALRAAYESEPFVAVLPDGQTPSIADAANTNICQVGCVVVGDTVQVVSSLDNLRKGAASQAVQGFNLVYGFPENSGLK